MWAVGSAAKTLDATNNRLTDLPPSISTLSNLQRLILATNQLSALPVQISALTSLKVGVLPHFDFFHLNQGPSTSLLCI